VESGKPLTKRDLMSIVFLPLMRSEATKTERVKKSLKLTNQLPESDEQMQIQAMLILLGEKFLNKDDFEKLKGELSILKMVQWFIEEGEKKGRQDGLKEGRQDGLKEGRQDGLKEGRQEQKLAIAKKLILQNAPTAFVIELTELDAAIVEGLRTE
jgi:flagellar biosynthesis/type III secretory pathway protein FliH